MSTIKDDSTFGFEFRKDLYYSKDHLWVKVEADGKVRVGFDDIVAKGSHEIFMMKLLPVNTAAKAKGKIGIIESRKYTGPIVSPIGGTVVDVNPEIKRGGPTVIIDAPYEVWLSVLKPSNLTEDLKGLMTGDAALEWFKKEAEPLKDEMEHYNNVKKEANAKYEG